jgi:hypothetical protein
VGLKRGPLSLMSTIEELLGRKISGSSLENRKYGRKGSVVLTMQHPVSENVGTNFADKWWSLGRYSSLVDFRLRSFFYIYILDYGPVSLIVRESK